MYKIFCEVHGGVTGYRAGYMKSDGKLVSFKTRKEAQAKADSLNLLRNSNPHRVVQCSYAVDYDG